MSLIWIEYKPLEGLGDTTTAFVFVKLIFDSDGAVNAPGKFLYHSAYTTLSFLKSKSVTLTLLIPL